MNKDKFFIYVGPPKTASTWLFNMLDKHPETEMPLLKELRYFYVIDEVGQDSLFQKLFGKQRLLQQRRRRFLRFFKRRLKKVIRMEPESWKYFSFLFHYFFPKWNDEWYKSLFPESKLSGDVSPPYCFISEKTVEKVRSLNPRTKIIIGLRNPVDRAWSFARMKYLKGEGRKNISQIDKSEVLNFFKNRAMLEANDYARLINKWEKYFRKEQILVYYFEELEEDPQKLFNRICTFLEIEPITLSSVNNKANKGVIEEIPTEYEEELINLNYSHIAEFAKAYPNKYSLAWLAKYKDKRPS